MEVVDKRSFFPASPPSSTDAPGLSSSSSSPSSPSTTHLYADDDVGRPLDQDHELPSNYQHAAPNSCSGLYQPTSPARKLIKSIVDFGGVGDGSTLNTGAFRSADDPLKANARVGG